MESSFAASEIDTSKPHPARMYNAYLGGNDNYAADREAVRRIVTDFPEVPRIARANRAFLQRAVRFLAAEAGIRQFIDIGTGIPSAGNVHEVAGQVAPDTRIAYVDNDHCKSCCAHTFGAVQREESNTEAIRSERPWAAEQGGGMKRHGGSALRPSWGVLARCGECRDGKDAAP